MDKGPLQVALAVVIGVALIGFFAGTDARDYEAAARRDGGEASDTEPVVPEALSYVGLRAHPRTSPSGWSDDVAALRAAGPGVLDPVELDGDKGDDIFARAALRAYDGAPPRIPHAIRQDAVPECLACHDEGLRLRGLLAPQMSHHELTSCTQCHVVTESPVPGDTALPADPRAVDNRFDGLDSPTSGSRAWSVAPPQLPHRTFMREQCDSCHGVNGRDSIRSSHPWRESCSQCHAATSDGPPGLTP